MGMFSSWFSYFKDPVVLVGLVLLFGYLVFKLLLKHKVIKQIPAQFNKVLPKMLIDFGYVVGLLVVVLGMGLKHNALKNAEQQNALLLLKAEYEHNVTVVKNLSQYTVDVLQLHRLVVHSLHADGSKILSTIFPNLNEKEKVGQSISKQVTTSFDQLSSLRLLKNKVHMNAFNTVKIKIKSELESHLRTLKNRQKMQGDQSMIQDAIWTEYHDVFYENNDFNVASYSTLLNQMKSLKSQYVSTLKVAEHFFAETSDFMNRNTFLSNGDVYEILTKEQKSEAAITSFATTIRESVLVVEEASSLFNFE